MGRDGHPKERQKTDLERKKAASRKSYDRILIVSEGKKTEPNYFKDICSCHRIPSANVVVQPGKDGSAPIQVVNYAERLFRKGDLNLGIEKKAFERVYAVFDRDCHESYIQAIQKAEGLNGKLVNDTKTTVHFQAITSVPCFELWFLLHFEDIFKPLQPTEALSKLQRYLPSYGKGSDKMYEKTKNNLKHAIIRAKKLRQNATQETRNTGPFTDVVELVELLTSLSDEDPAPRGA